MDVLAKNAIRMYCYKVSPWTLMNSVVFDCDGNFKAKNFMEDGLSLSAKYAAVSHTHNYLPLSGGTLSGNLTINGNLNGYNIGGSVANSNNGFITGGAVYNALGNVQIIEILDTGKLKTSAAVANGGTATLNTGFVMWQCADRYVVIPTQTSYCNVDAVALNSEQDSLNITLRNTSGASHTLSARFLIIYYKYK